MSLKRRLEEFLGSAYPPLLFGALDSKRVDTRRYACWQEYWCIPEAVRTGREGTSVGFPSHGPWPQVLCALLLRLTFHHMTASATPRSLLIAARSPSPDSLHDSLHPEWALDGPGGGGESIRVPPSHPGGSTTAPQWFRPPSSGRLRVPR